MNQISHPEMRPVMPPEEAKPDINQDISPKPEGPRVNEQEPAKQLDITKPNEPLPQVPQQVENPQAVAIKVQTEEEKKQEVTDLIEKPMDNNLGEVAKFADEIYKYTE